MSEDNPEADSIKLTIERSDFDLKPHPKIVDFEIVYEASDRLAEEMSTVINESIISTLIGKAPQHPRRVRELAPYFRRMK